MGDKIKDYILIIPARCGSKGIKFKNIIDLKGHPLIYYTIKIAKKLKSEKLIDEIYISTDCKEIKQVCESFDVKVGSLRKKSLSKDNSKTIDLIGFIINEYQSKGIHFKNILILQPTSPLRKYNQVRDAIKMFNDKNENSLISVFEDTSLSDNILYYQKGLNLIPKVNTHNTGKRRQENSSLYIRNGAIYIVKTDFFKEQNALVCSSPIGFLMDKITSLNIDEQIDLDIARKLL